MRLELNSIFCDEKFYNLQWERYREEFWKHELNDLYILVDALEGHRDNLDNTGNKYKEKNKKVLEDGTGLYITMHIVLDIRIYIVTRFLDKRELETNILLHL